MEHTKRLDLAQNVIAPPAKAAIFLTVTVNRGREAKVRTALADVSGLTRAVGFRVPEATLSCVVGVGADLWDRMYDTMQRPIHLHRFAPIAGPEHVAVSTAGDLLFHIRATRPDLCFELSHQLLRALDRLVEPVDEVHGFRYWDERDLLGFVDGTESPHSVREASMTALVGEEDPPYAGGSYVIVQKYLHDLDAWDGLSVAEQERVVGREKLSDLELSDDDKPSNSHVAATTIVDPDGTARQIVRENLPFGNAAAGEFGTYFIGYAADPGVIERMLHRMFVGEPVGNTDRILDFSTAVTGCLFFAPPAGVLETAGPAPATSVVDQPNRPEVGPASMSPGSLGIGSLKRSSTS